ncbi:hypothetical protein AB0362_12955 [Rhodococcus sp. NPDC079359]|uniref:hypothetical protein n=1 Tax=Rhodococcus sp. NPDC079359 TaxID=3154961 RepID=UPI00344F5157
MIDVITVRGTGNTPGPRNGMCGLVARKLQVTEFRLSDCLYPATIGEIGRVPGQQAYPLDVSVDLGVADLAWQVRETKNRVGLISYSLGGIVVSRFLEGVQRGEFLNANGTKLDVAFAVNIANPARAKGDSAVPAPGYGLHSSHGKWPANTVTLELANPRDIITSAPANSPVRRITGAISPYAAMEQRKAWGGRDVVNEAADEVHAINDRDWLSRFRPGRYSEAIEGLFGYLAPYGRPGRTQHTMYGVEPYPFGLYGETWTDYAARWINEGWGK